MENFPQHDNKLIEKNKASLILLKEKKVSWTLKSMHKHRIILIESDITKIGTEVIVNAAQELLTGGGGVDGAIHEKAGPELLNEIIESIPMKANGTRCMTGEAKITKGYKLMSKYIIHTVAPYLDEKGNLQPELLRRCYKSVLKLVEQHGIMSVAFPPLGTGYYGYPMMDACIIAFEECYKWLEKNTKEIIIFSFISELQLNIARNLYNLVIS